MQNYAKQKSDVFCSGQTFTLSGESHLHLNIKLAHNDVRVTLCFIPKIREYEYFRISIQSLEDEIQIEK
jgi:hypothetical protein